MLLMFKVVIHDAARFLLQCLMQLMFLVVMCNEAPVSCCNITHDATNVSYVMHDAAHISFCNT